MHTNKITTTIILASTIFATNALVGCSSTKSTTSMVSKKEHAKMIELALPKASNLTGYKLAKIDLIKYLFNYYFEKTKQI